MFVAGEAAIILRLGGSVVVACPGSWVSSIPPGVVTLFVNFCSCLIGYRCPATEVVGVKVVDIFTAIGQVTVQAIQAIGAA
jgi:hypothetical protein